MAEHDESVLVWQWGRYGAGPRFAYELAWALRQFTSIRPLLSLSKHAELYDGLKTKMVVDFPIATYQGAADAMLKSISLPKRLKALERFIEVQQPIAAISVMPGYWDVFAALRLAKLGIPVLSIVHDAQSHLGERLAPVIAMHRRQMAKSAGIITLSEFVADRLQRQGTLTQRRHWTIAHPGFEFPDLETPAVSVSDYTGQRPLRLVLPGRLKRYKGAHLLLDALTRIDPAHVQARIIGTADNSDWAVAKKDLPNCVLDLRWLSEPELVAEIDRADVLLAPYIEASQSGVVALALARGRPVIATPVGGLPEQIQQRKTGLLAESATADALAACIGQFVDDPALYRQCAAGALAAGKDEIGWSRIAKRYADVVAEVGEKRR